MSISAARTARDLMTEGCVCVQADETIVQAARKMQDLGVGVLPICGRDDRLHGMLTDRDIVVKCIAEGKNPADCTAGELASDQVVWVLDDTSVDVVVQTMEQHQMRRLPVIDRNKRLCGIISQGDIARQLDHDTAGELVEHVSKGPAFQQPVGA